MIINIIFKHSLTYLPLQLSIKSLPGNYPQKFLPVEILKFIFLKCGFCHHALIKFSDVSRLLCEWILSPGGRVAFAYLSSLFPHTCSKRFPGCRGDHWQGRGTWGHWQDCADKIPRSQKMVAVVKNQELSQHLVLQQREVLICWWISATSLSRVQGRAFSPLFPQQGARSGPQLTAHVLKWMNNQCGIIRLRAKH